MNAVNQAVSKLGRIVGRAATMTTEAAGALGGAAVNGVVGGVTGAAAGVQRGISSGSHSTPAAALTMGTVGVVGLVEWPVLLTVGGAALLLRQLNRRPEATAQPAKPAPVKAKPAPVKAKPAAVKAAKPAKTTRAVKAAKPAKATKSAKVTKSANNRQPRRAGRAKSPSTRPTRARQ